MRIEYRIGHSARYAHGYNFNVNTDVIHLGASSHNRKIGIIKNANNWAARRPERGYAQFKESLLIYQPFIAVSLVNFVEVSLKVFFPMPRRRMILVVFF